MEAVEADQTYFGGEPEIAVLILSDRSNLPEDNAVTFSPGGNPVVAEDGRHIAREGCSRTADG